MGFMDLSTSVASKKHVDFNDARYQSAERLKQSGKKNVRSTFTLYDNKEVNKIAVQDITAAYALSDKHLPVGELLNKMVDLITDMEDGILDTEKDAVYAWKYSMALLQIYEDKSKRQDNMAVFDNGLKTSVINSQTFIRRYPGSYTNRTNFFDKKVKEDLAQHIIETFKDEALPQIHDTAIRQSQETAEKHNNQILDKIVGWAVDNYNCEVDSFYDIKRDERTQLFFSVNTIILHLRNGYDMSIIGYVGTDHDDKFAISIFNAQDISIKMHGERVSRKDVEDALTETSTDDPVDPLTKLIQLEKKKNAVLKEQYDILSDIKPMISKDVLQIPAAESVVGQDYIWGCEQWRETHEELPKDFKLEDVKLPKLEETEEEHEQEAIHRAIVADLENITDSIEQENLKAEEVIASARSLMRDPAELEDEIDDNIEEPIAPILPNQNDTTSEIAVRSEQSPSDIGNEEDSHAPMKGPSAEELVRVIDSMPSLFDETPKREDKVFGERENVEFQMPMLETLTGPKLQDLGSNKQMKEFDTASTLLPGFIPSKKQEKEEDFLSVTQAAKPLPVFESEPEPEIATIPIPSPIPQKDEEDEIVQPELMFDDLDSLFA